MAGGEGGYVGGGVGSGVGGADGAALPHGSAIVACCAIPHTFAPAST